MTKWISSLIGKRVQVPAWTDTWMMGDRYGTIVEITELPGRLVGTPRVPFERARTIARVRLDKSGRTKKFRAMDLEEV
jgi:hypothetical protein